jgi:replicative DNA helicase
MSTAEVQCKVIGGLLVADTDFGDRVNLCGRELTNEHFVGRLQGLYHLIKRYYFLTTTKLPWEKCAEALVAKNVSEDELLKYKLLYEKCCSLAQEDASFRFSIEVLKEQTNREKLVDTLVDAMEILQEGKKIGRKEMQGYSDSREFLTSSLSKLDRMEGLDVREGSVNEDGDRVLAEYAAAKKKESIGLLTGLTEIDSLTFGLQPGELMLVAGYTGDCKTTTCINIAHHVVYKLKKNVVYATGETLLEQVRRKVVSLRSRDEKYGYREGLSLGDVKSGKLTEKQEEVLKKVLADIQYGYGRFQIFQFPYRATLDFIRNRVSMYQTDFPVDLVIIDEVRLLRSGARRQSIWEEMDDLLKAMKQFAVSFNGGKGVPVITPYQVNRTSWKEAVEGKQCYTKSCLSNSSEAEKSSDIIMSNLRMPFDKGGNEREIRCSVLKYRDGREINEFLLECDLDKGYVGSRTSHVF